MIRVERIASPEVLSNHAAQWTADLLAARIAEQEDPNNRERTKQREAAEKKYNHREVKNALKDMFANKCAYCESHVTHVAYGEIEHFRACLNLRF